MEYQKQMLLAGIRADGGEILSRIKKPAPQLERVSDESFNKILRGLTPSQVDILSERRERKTQERKRVFADTPFPLRL